MMSGRFSDMAISLELSMGHTHMIYQLKAPIFLYLMISYRCLTGLNQRKSEFKTYFPTYIFSSKISRLILYRFCPYLTGMLITFIWRKPCLRFLIKGLVLILC